MIFKKLYTVTVTKNGKLKYLGAYADEATATRVKLLVTELMGVGWVVA